MEELRKYEKKIMPTIGCMERRKYMEAYLRKNHYIDPCLMCDKRENCVKAVVGFEKSTVN